MIPEDILSILACPKCKGNLIFKQTYFICLNCKLKYEIKEEIPDFLIEHSKKLTDEELKAIQNERTS